MRKNEARATVVLACAVITISLFGTWFATRTQTVTAQKTVTQSRGSTEKTSEETKENSYIKWVDFSPNYAALRDTMDLDISTYNTQRHLDWVDTLSYLSCLNGGDFSSYKKASLDKLIDKLGENKTVDELMADNKYYIFYKKAYGAVLDGLVGDYKKILPDKENGGYKVKESYGLKAYLPIAEGFWFTHSDDFGASRTYGYKRKHLGNDLMGSVGTPIVAVEGGTVEAFGWNRYGGWRIAIRSFDGKRSYYYAHLLRNKPYHCDMQPGATVKAGQVIGYLGMTGYSTHENVNGMNVPHLHLGLQLIFDESQKEGENQIWLDLYALVELLCKNRATVIRNEENGEYYRVYDICDENYPSDMQTLTTLPPSLTDNGVS